MCKSKVVTVLFVVSFLFVILPCCESSPSLRKDDKRSCTSIFREVRTRSKKIYNWKKCKASSCIINVNYTVNVRKPSCCPNWYWASDIKECVPRCRSGCTNGTCIAPDVCRCDPPLILTNNTCVLPVCNPPCGFNSQCTADDTCTCDDNFFSINATHCAPICPTGFFNDPIECKPKCDNTCVNASCTAPNTCSCIDGHKMINKYTCIPECNPSCENADCTAPDTCACIDGHKMINKYTCIPACTPSCENADCTAPNTCQCFEGFVKESNSKCIPKCDQCENGNCIAPDTCECLGGYEKKDGICKPVCKRPCTNGICSAPDTCSCNLGYTLDPVNKFNCLPICEPKCLNASCVSPNTCSCLTGYYMTGNNWTCSPRCDNCENGMCVEPNDCRCNNGFIRESNKCKPICEKACKNGVCSEPNVCSCNTGFTVDKTDKFECKPICTNVCVNSTCISPAKCQCLPGYESTEKDYICKPKCASCIHGQCEAPDVCKCNTGYIMSNGVCLPVCSSACVNGYCSSPETCSCDSGFKNNPDEPHICYKKCVGLCDNGECTHKGECICNPGFELVNDTCASKEPVDCDTCLSNCTNGDCFCHDGTPCLLKSSPPDEVQSTTSLAGLELTWVLGCAVGLLILILIMALIIQMARKKPSHENKSVDNGAVYGSVVYTAPNTLMRPRMIYENDNSQEDTFYEEVTSRYRNVEDYATNEALLNGSQLHNVS